MKKTVLCLIAILAACGVYSQKKMTKADYIDLYRDIAVREMKQYRIPASITLAQGIIESGCGNSRLAVEANNHFGIKCKKEWTGGRIYHDDDEKGECFRSYRSAEESYVDHSVFLASSSRYTVLFELDITDYKGWANGLKQCGYATNPQYAQILIKTIEENNLHVFDQKTKPSGPKEVVEKELEIRPVKPVTSAYKVRERGMINGVGYVVVRSGDEFNSLAVEVGLTPRKFMSYNDLSGRQLPVPGEIMYVQAKKKRSSNAYTHNVRQGETIRSISQEYGITVNALKKMNPQLRLSPPYVGQILNLR